MTTSMFVTISQNRIVQNFQRSTIAVVVVSIIVASSLIVESTCFVPSTPLLLQNRMYSNNNNNNNNNIFETNEKAITTTSSTRTRARTTTSMETKVVLSSSYFGQRQRQFLLYFSRTDVPHPNAPNEWGIPISSSLPPLYNGMSHDTIQNKRRQYQLPNGGKVTLVGSGPGDPNLLTVTAYKLLTQADPTTDVIIIDRLVSQEIINLIPKSVPIKIARKMPGCAELAQEEIYWWTYQFLNQGKHVIRLKIGDPFVFGRGSEEVLQFRKFGIESNVVPGVSAAFSAPLLGGIPVTHRGVANQVVMCTGYGRDGTSPDLIQYHKEQTIVFLMAVGRLHELCQKLQIDAGYPSNTPVAIVEKAGCPDQRTVVGDMITIADLAIQYNIQPPSTIVVGNVVNVLLEHDEKTGQHVTGLIQQDTLTQSVFLP